MSDAFWDIPDASMVRDGSTRTVLGPMRQNLMLLMGRFGEENYSRAATVQDLLNLGIVNVDRGALYATGGGGTSSGGSSNAASAAADRAQTSATNAASSASSASSSASSASTSAGLASTAADQASNFASLASSSESAAAASASAAAASASAAASSAQDAEDALLLQETTEKTNNYTLVLADQNKVVLMNVSAAGKAITVPTNASVAFPVGAVVHIYNASADSVSVDGDTGVTVRNTGSVSQYGEARLRKRAANEWVLTIY